MTRIIKASGRHRRRAVEEMVRLWELYAPDRFEFVHPDGPDGSWVRGPIEGWAGWARLGLDEGGLPAHVPMGVTEGGDGQQDDATARRYVCWRPYPNSPLTRASRLAWLT
jgi:hypothetical protein